jgi:RasGEF N-terminal motif
LSSSSSSSSRRKKKKKKPSSSSSLTHSRNNSLCVTQSGVVQADALELVTRYSSYPFTEADSGSNLLFSKEEKDENGRPLVHAATLLKLVELLGTPSYSEAGYLEDFLMCYTDFMSSDRMLELLEWLFHVPPPAQASDKAMLQFKMKKQVPAQMACLRALSVWVDHYFADVRSDVRAAKRLRRFMHDTLATSKYRLGDRLRVLLCNVSE